MVLTESNYETNRRGSIEVICGSMFSGKTEELIRRLKRAKIARQRVEIFKPAIDVRYSEENIVSHDSTSILSTPVDNSHSILLMASGVDVVGIDEARFFDDCRRVGYGFPSSSFRAYAFVIVDSRRCI